MNVASSRDRDRDRASAVSMNTQMKYEDESPWAREGAHEGPWAWDGEDHYGGP